MNSHGRTLRAIRTGILGLSALAAGSVLSAQAPATVRDLLSDVLHKPPAENFFVIPVAGHVVGVNGNEFRTDVTISASATTRVAVAWIAEDADNASRPLSFLDIGPGPAFFENIVESSLHETGLGALVVAALAPDGTVDPAARIAGFARIWTAAAGCPGTSSIALRSGRFGNDNHSTFAYGLRLDAGHRANFGVVNPSSVAMSITVFSGISMYDLSVPPFSMRQVSIDGASGTAPDGSLFLGLAPTPNRFAAYAVSVDEVSGDGWLVNLSE